MLDGTCRLFLEPCEPRRLLSVYIVGPGGTDSNPGSLGQPFATIQHAIDVASRPGDVVQVRGGTYHEMLTFAHSGSARGGFITLEPFAGEHVVLSGQGAASNDIGFGNDMIQIVNKSFIRVMGLEITDDQGITDDAMAVRIQGAGSGVQVLNNTIHDITGTILSSAGGNNTGFAGAAIQVYGSSLGRAYTNVVIDGNTIFNCQPGDSETETVTLNGNVSGFRVTRNTVHDCNNIGIDMIGGEADVLGRPAGTRNLPVARNGVCAGNTVFNIHANYGGGFAAGIYIDGGQHILVSGNRSFQNDIGVEVAAENRGYAATRDVVQDNILFDNTQAGLALGGAAADNGRTRSCWFINNTVVNNDTTNTGSGQLLIQFASGNVIANNIFVAAPSGVLIGSAGAGNIANHLDFDLYWATTTPQFNFNVGAFNSLVTFQKSTGQEKHSVFADPQFAELSVGDFHLLATSPAARSGSRRPGQFDPVDFDGNRRQLPPDMGAY